MYVIGTAGHVDHGKSTLIAALTGTHPDRLKEEQAREMTIELGFGWLTLPNGEEIGIVDVPGHRDFIENMLSGIGGIDAALLVIAADEGLMPQTKEHLAILDLLQIPTGLIVLTKTDLASDSGWLDLVEADIRAAVASTCLKDAPIVRVSAKTKTGLDHLVTDLQILLSAKPTRSNLNRPRLPIDRAFTMSGFGTVVTGTLLDGQFSTGDEVEILPDGITGRVRGLQTHKKKSEIALPGSRTALNISGVEATALQRGNVVIHPGSYTATRRLDAQLRLLADITAPLRHNDEVKFFTGASESIATVRLLEGDELHAGNTGWIQLELRKPIVAVRGDRYIVRRPSPGETLGGGTVVDHQPAGRHKRFDSEVINSLKATAKGKPVDILFETAMSMGPASIKEIVTRSRLDANDAESALQALLSVNSLILIEPGTPAPTSDLILVTAPRWNALRDEITSLIETYHTEYRLRVGMPREELKSKMKLSARLFNACIARLVAEQVILNLNGWLAKPGFEIRFNGQEQVKVEELRRKFAAHPFVTPSVKECQAEVGGEILNVLINSGELVAVSNEVIFRKSDYVSMVETIQNTIRQNGSITLAHVRDLFDTSRKYAQAMLEHLDATGITLRAGDVRKLKKP